MTALPTTAAMVQAAQDAYDVAAAEWAVASARWMESVAAAEWEGPESVERSAAKAVIAKRAKDYAWSVLRAVRVDADRSRVSA